MKDERLERYWNSIPIGKENAASYDGLNELWGIEAKGYRPRNIRLLLAELSAYDNGDGYVLIRSSKNGGGFYRTQNIEDILTYGAEVRKKAISTFKPLAKIRRIVNDSENYDLFELAKGAENNEG